MEESRMIIKKTNEEVTFSIKVIHAALHKLVYEIVENVIDELIDKVHEHLMSLIAFMHDFLYHRTKEDRRSSCCSLHAYIKAVLFIPIAKSATFSFRNYSYRLRNVYLHRNQIRGLDTDDADSMIFA